MSSQSHIILAASPIMMMTMKKIMLIIMVMLMIIWTIMVIITVMIMIIAIVPRTSGKDAKALVKESDHIVGYTSLSTIYIVTAQLHVNCFCYMVEIYHII